MPYICDSDSENPATMLVTNLDDGSSVALCAACFPDWVRAMAVAFTPEPEPVDPDTDEPTDEPTDQASATVDSPAPVALAKTFENVPAPVTTTNGSEGPKSMATGPRIKKSAPEQEGSTPTTADQR